MGHRLSRPAPQLSWTASSARQMNSICARCRRTGIGVLAGVVVAHEPVAEAPIRAGDAHVRALDDRCGPTKLSNDQSRSRVVPHNTGFWLVTAAFVSLQAFGTVPTPLSPLYAVRDGLRSTAVTLGFACMVVGSGPSLYFFGHLSDRLGRRRIVLPALWFGIA